MERIATVVSENSTYELLARNCFHYGNSGTTGHLPSLKALRAFDAVARLNSHPQRRLDARHPHVGWHGEADPGVLMALGRRAQSRLLDRARDLLRAFHEHDMELARVCCGVRTLGRDTGATVCRDRPALLGPDHGPIVVRGGTLARGRGRWPDCSAARHSAGRRVRR